MYFDNELKIPDIKTLVFSSFDYEKGKFYFQDPESYLKNGILSIDGDIEDTIVRQFDRDCLYSIYDWRGLLEGLSDNRKSQEAGRIFD